MEPVTPVVARSAKEMASVAFIDLAGFSAITDVYGDETAIGMLGLFERMVATALEGYAPPVKWMGDEVMLSFPDPKSAIVALGHILSECRGDPRLPLTRTAVHHGPVIRRAGDLFGSTVNIAARIAAIAAPGQLLATRSIADVAGAEGILVEDMGLTALRSLPDAMQLYAVHLTPTPDPAWIDPVCKMHAPFATFQRAAPAGRWFCSEQCEEAYLRSPETYA